MTFFDIEFKNFINNFFIVKNCITKAANIYIDFWSLLINPNQDNAEDLVKLNECGSKINIMVEEIELHFQNNEYLLLKNKALSYL